jgi:GTP-binding protein
MHFATPTFRAPMHAEQGGMPERRKLRIELKLLADVGIVGFPNVGKSTLIAAISKARPKVADYPFTTLVPNLGVVSRGEYRSFVVADIPGLIEGAAEGAGLGHRFLKHIERTRVLLILISADPSPERAPLRDLATLRSELERFDPELAKRPALIAISKLDLPEVREALPELQRALEAEGVTVSAFSAATREGLDELLNRMETLLDQHPVLHRPRAQPLPTRKDRPHAQSGDDERADDEQ